MKFAYKFWAKFTLWLALVGVLAGCASGGKISVAGDTIWTPFIENNGTREEISFTGMLGDEQNSTRPIVGTANIRTNLGVRKIGDMRALAHKTSNIVLNLADGAQIDVSSPEGRAQAKAAWGLKFYEFKKGRIETIVYRYDDKKPLCEAFLSGEAVKTRSVTNYYLQDEAGFFAGVLQTEMLAQKGANITHSSFIFEISDSEELEKARKFTSSEGVKSLIDGDVRKQGRLLYILCTM